MRDTALLDIEDATTNFGVCVFLKWLVIPALVKYSLSVVGFSDSRTVDMKTERSQVSVVCFYGLLRYYYAA